TPLAASPLTPTPVAPTAGMPPMPATPPADRSPSDGPAGGGGAVGLGSDSGRGSGASASVGIVPKGLRSFDAEDAGFFLRLLPGARDRDGLPESIRFWKQRIEPGTVRQPFSVGLLCGASGCGKSSLIKAGLLPRLSPEVLVIYLRRPPTTPRCVCWPACIANSPRLARPGIWRNCCGRCGAGTYRRVTARCCW
ncbi:MAG: hypothetical protein ACKO3P_24810, partial [Planctomycetaceae bacterium]